MTIAETLRWLGLDDPAVKLEVQAGQEAGQASPVGVALVMEPSPLHLRPAWPPSTRSPYHPVLIDAGYADLNTPIPWSNDRTLRFRFSPPPDHDSAPEHLSPTSAPKIEDNGCELASGS